MLANLTTRESPTQASEAAICYAKTMPTTNACRICGRTENRCRMVADPYAPLAGQSVINCKRASKTLCTNPVCAAQAKATRTGASYADNV